MIKRLRDKILLSSFVGGLVSRSEKFNVSKQHNISLHKACVYIYKELKDNSIVAESKAVAYNLTLAVFPAIIFLFTLIPHLVPYLEMFGLAENSIYEFLEGYMPPDLYSGLESTIKSLVEEKNNALLSFGFLFALFMSTNGMMSLIDSFNRCYKTREKRNFLKTRLIALFLTIIMILVMIVSMVSLVLGELIINTLTEYIEFVGWLDWASILRFSAFFLTYFLGISVIYFLAPAVQRRFRFISVGSVIASVLSTIVSLGFSFYLNLASFDQVYGSIGALIAFMIWVQWMAMILLVGFEVNAGIDRARRDSAKSSEIV